MIAGVLGFWGFGVVAVVEVAFVVGKVVVETVTVAVSVAGIDFNTVSAEEELSPLLFAGQFLGPDMKFELVCSAKHNDFM